MSIEKLFRDEMASPEMIKDVSEENGKDEIMPKRPEKKKLICFKCQGEGHYAYRCPNNNKGTVPTVPKEKLSSNVTEAKEAENIKGLSLLAKTQSRF